MSSKVVSRGLFTLVCVLCVLPAAASFDLMLIPSGGQIRRYDPESNVNLGGFNVPNTNNVTLDQANNRMFVSDTSAATIRAYNYSTGAALGAWAVGGAVTHLAYHAGSNSVFYTTVGGALERLSLTDSSLQSLSVFSGGTSRTLAVRGNTLVMMASFTNSQLITQSYDATSGAVISSAFLPATIQPGSSLGKGLLVPLANGNQRMIYVFRGNSGGTFLGSSDLTATGGFVSSASSFFSTAFSTAVMPSVVRGHNGYFIAGVDSAVPNTLRVEEFSATGILMRQNTVSGYALSGSHFGIDNVVAPEPGTLAALALGTVALLRRRRKKS